MTHLSYIGDLDKLDAYVRRKMAQRLDTSTGADWRELAKRLGLGTLESAFAIHSSPTIQVLAQYEVSEDCLTSLATLPPAPFVFDWSCCF